MLKNFNTLISKVILQQRLPSPWKLVKDIQQNYYKQEILEYSKQKLLSLSDKDWKFYNDLKNVDESFKLVIVFNSRNKLKIKFQIQPSKFDDMLQFFKPKPFNQFIWIDSDIFSKNYKDLENFQSLLKHQLGHVWTAIQHYEKNSSIGNTGINSNNLNLQNLSNNQKFILKYFCNNDKDILEQSYNYVIKNDETGGNYQFLAIIDNIIRFLINDYLKNFSNITTQEYINNVILKTNHCAKNINFIQSYDQYNEYQKSWIFYLYLIFHFGNKKQIKIFKTQLSKQFGKI